MKITIVQEIKTQIGHITGLSDTVLHMCIGLAILIAAVSYLKKPFQLIVPWLIVLSIAVTGEFIDMQGDFIRLGYWRWDESLRDVTNTIFLPTVILFFIRFAVFPLSQYLFQKQEPASKHTEPELAESNIVSFSDTGKTTFSSITLDNEKAFPSLQDLSMHSQEKNLKQPVKVRPASDAGFLTKVTINDDIVIATGDKLIHDENSGEDAVVNEEDQRKTA